jgi:hypothetical protein
MPAALRSETPYSELSPPAMIAIFRFIYSSVNNFACKITFFFAYMQENEQYFQKKDRFNLSPYSLHSTPLRLPLPKCQSVYYLVHLLSQSS